MKLLIRLILPALALLLIASTGHAVILDWKVDVSLNEDKTSDWLVTYTHSDYTQQSDFFLLSSVTSYNVTADGVPVSCTLYVNIGSSIVCNNINAREVVYRLHTLPLITPIKQMNIFSHRFSITQTTGKFTLNIKLPFGAALAEQSKLEGTGLNAFEPDFGKQGSDGRRIFVEWIMERPMLGETRDFSVVYEYVKPIDFNIFVIIIAAIIIAFLVLLVFFFRRHSVKEFLPVLTDSERKIMEIIIREKKVDQRAVVKETDFSKAKASRIIQDLEKRGLVEKKPKGRTNIITLQKAINLKKIEKKETKEKRANI